MDEMLFQAEDLIILNPGLSDWEVAIRLAAWLVSVPRCTSMRPETEPDREVLVEFVRVMRHTPSFHPTPYMPTEISIRYC